MFYKDKVVLVTGGTGFVGTHIVQELLREGAKVRVSVRNRPMVIEDERIETVYADLTKQEDCLSVSKGVDFIFHAAGAVSGAGGSMSGITTNLILTSQMLQAAITAKVERFLLFSSSTGYPEMDHPVKEDEMWSAPPHPSVLGYGWMRRYFERLGEFVSTTFGMKVSIVRPTAVYGRYDNFDSATSHVIPALIRRAVAKENPYIVWGSGREVRDFLHITDLARGCLLLLEKRACCDPVNIGYGKTISIKEIVYMILAAAEHNDADVVFDSSKPTTIPCRMVDTSKAKEVLGFEPMMTLEEGIADTVEWYKKLY
ncbi:MAG: NAD-dependent epimerase/dehydratase family protein [Nitrospirae bacterium]|nr:NAD-dependent epimerase/dehydratase family protein [Nitrospirota bacterium]